MNSRKTPSPYSMEMVFLTCFGLGLCPWAPGTMASLAMVPLLYALGQLAIPTILLLPWLCLLVVGSGMVVEMVQKSRGVNDPPWIVVDEGIGMLTGFVLWPSTQWAGLLLLFALFRFFDIVKVWPASFFDRKWQHGMGTILDDVVAGLYAGGSNALVHQFFDLGESNFL